MKIVVVGASGRIGTRVATMLSGNHEVIRVGVRTGDFLCDYTNPASVRQLFEQTGTFDALIAVVGKDSVFMRGIKIGSIPGLHRLPQKTPGR